MKYYFPKYQYNLGKVKRYTDTKFKVVCLNSCLQSGIEDDKKFTAKGEANETKLDNSLSRTKSRVFELAICNSWECFVTFTLDKEKYDRYNLQKYKKDLSQFIRNFNRIHNREIKYLLIPEMHKDGAWHMHGFMMGLKEDDLTLLTLEMKLPSKIINRINQGKKVYSWNAYSKKFGFSDIELIENHEASSKYITKYITKESMRTITELNAHMYYCSQRLKSSEVIHQETICKEIDDADYSNEYVKIKWVDSIEAAMSWFKDDSEVCNENL